jgi:hypothetical protein
MGCALCGGSSYEGYSYFLGRPRLRFAPAVDDCSMDTASVDISLFPSDDIFGSFVQPFEAKSEDEKNTALC